MMQIPQNHGKGVPFSYQFAGDDSCWRIPSHFVAMFFSSMFFYSTKPAENSSPQETANSENKPTPDAQLLIVAGERELAAVCLRTDIHCRVVNVEPLR
jgi:hypothetical protein